ncbi:MAG: nucleoside:proton symporter [Desulfuromonadales bacterium C00003068]|jgi:CNT family concentrative nucleoside transporter|nr:MAG: nucleoside:proton symporter [Desulfuromonadales bacterium C00003068]
MILQSLLGLVVFIFLAWLFSENRRKFPVKLVLIGVGLQFLLAAILFKIPLFQKIFLLLNQAVIALEQSTQAGTSMVFGYLGGGPLPFVEPFAGSAYILAFRGLPMVLLISALSSLLFYWRILPRIVNGMSHLLQKTLGIGGAEGVGVAANIFVGMIESPLLIRPYLRHLSRSELFTLMTCGMATIAGTMMALYATILSAVIPDITGHILTASLISAPAAIVIAKIMIPETQEKTDGQWKIDSNISSSMDAIVQGTIQGIQLLINIIAMIIVMVALVHLCNMILGLIPTANEPISLQQIMGVFLAPITWLMGIPWHEAHIAGELFGTKTIINEFIAYLNMAQLPTGALSDRSLRIMSYALCGFANPGSVGIMIGGLRAMAPERGHEIVALGFRSLLAGTLATSMTATVASLLL